MQALAMLVSLPIFTLPHACPTPVVVYKTHGLSGSARWTSVVKAQGSRPCRGCR